MCGEAPLSWRRLARSASARTPWREPTASCARPGRSIGRPRAHSAHTSSTGTRRRRGCWSCLQSGSGARRGRTTCQACPASIRNSGHTSERAHVRQAWRQAHMLVAAACSGPREKRKGARGAGLCVSTRKEAKGEAGVQASVPAGGPPVWRLLENILPRALVEKACTRRGSSRFTSSSRTPAMRGRPRAWLGAGNGAARSRCACT